MVPTKPIEPMRLRGRGFEAAPAQTLDALIPQFGNAFIGIWSI